MGRKQDMKPLIGWREWIGFPDLGLPQIKAKVDTGARTSALHAYDIRRVRRGARSFVRFKVHPLQRDSRTTVETLAPFVEMRRVRASSGHAAMRPVVLVEIELLGQRWPIELTLTSRDEMGFRMLLGRQAVRGHFAIDPGRSFIGGQPARRRKKATKKTTKRADRSEKASGGEP